MPQGREDEARLTEDIITLARHYSRCGYRKIAESLRVEAGCVVNDKRVERIWRPAGLKVLAKQPKRRRLWLADGSCIRLRAEHANHVWNYDFAGTAPMTGVSTVCLTRSMSSRANASPSVWRAASSPSMSPKMLAELFIPAR